MSAHSGVRRSESIPGGQAGYRAADEIRGGARSPKFVGTPTASTAWRGAWQAYLGCVRATRPESRHSRIHPASDPDRPSRLGLPQQDQPAVRREQATHEIGGHLLTFHGRQPERQGVSSVMACVALLWPGKTDALKRVSTQSQRVTPCLPSRSREHGYSGFNRLTPDSRVAKLDP